jgi:hypothetical protein
MERKEILLVVFTMAIVIGIGSLVNSGLIGENVAGEAFSSKKTCSAYCFNYGGLSSSIDMETFSDAKNYGVQGWSDSRKSWYCDDKGADAVALSTKLNVACYNYDNYVVFWGKSYRFSGYNLN